MQAKEKQFIISESVRKGFIDYLVKRPYEEVASGIQALVSLPELGAEKPVKKEPIPPLKILKKEKNKKK